MFSKIKPYMGSYIKYTYAALGAMFAGLIASVLPFFMEYRIIRPLIEGEKPSASYYAIHIAIIFVCELAYAILYVWGLEFFHISAYNTLKNIRISQQKKLECQPLGTVQDMGNGKIKKTVYRRYRSGRDNSCTRYPRGDSKSVNGAYRYYLYVLCRPETCPAVILLSAIRPVCNGYDVQGGNGTHERLLCRLC